MAATIQALPTHAPPEARLVFAGARWHDYEAMLQIVGERRIRVTYDQGAMEVTMPSQRHEQAAQLLGLFVTRLAEEWEIPYEPLGMTTWKLPGAAKGLEADQCYYIQHHAVAREKEVLALDIDPPPDLAIEVDITTSSLDRMAIYAALGVPEVWRYDGRTVSMFQLQPAGQYQASVSSRSFPGLRPTDIERFIELGRTTDKIRWARELRDWARSELASRGDPGAPPDEEPA
jgi:Uma2 family endonuclease